MGLNSPVATGGESPNSAGCRPANLGQTESSIWSGQEYQEKQVLKLRQTEMIQQSFNISLIGILDGPLLYHHLLAVIVLNARILAIVLGAL